ncbi:type II toxin-antitoxin system HicA family toxin [Crocosphaera sp. UHCC 0190]|uniref:type II toxin-antitoxin system HicA family toxin n=1 Tax=unclassified Crocosphaera TaxID=2623705 RepID=UPI002B1F1436|nr:MULTISPECIES: type II toxin-antitoxin system HicA family toxin [unclassified Crocosphaera]MEA5508925.1 type II toxin-antitoxin system HicA family toxin [Crocosphaera sp. UHCC 0190]MEA5534900.1 type II toxin-antitoxin system HicA family toxin [Crocosphaera sp. XPORK-15E]
MSERLSSITAKKALRKLKKAGFREHHQRGSHLVLKHSDGRMVVLPIHSSDIPKGTLYNIVVNQSKLSIEEWNNL